MVLPPCATATLKRRVIILAFNDQGKRIGETHHNARIPNIVVDRIRDRHEDDGLGYKALAIEFSLSVNTIRKICTYERRAQTPVRYKRVKVHVSQAIEVNTVTESQVDKIERFLDGWEPMNGPYKPSRSV